MRGQGRAGGSGVRWGHARLGLDPAWYTQGSRTGEAASQDHHPLQVGGSAERLLRRSASTVEQRLTAGNHPI